MSSAISRNDTSVAPAITGAANPDNIFFSFPAVLEPWRPTILSCSASVIQVFSGYPLDTIKTRMQTTHFPSAFSCFKETVNHEGIRGLFRGIASPLVTASASKSLSVSTYTYTKPWVAKYEHMLYTPLQPGGIINDKNLLLAVNNIPVSVATGILSGTLVSLFSCPFEYIKITSQLSLIAGQQQNLKNTALKGIFHIAREIIKYDGFKGLYSGFRIQIWRDTISSALFFTTYETFKIGLQAFTVDGKIKGTDIPSGQLSIITAGAASGLFSSVMTFPIDTIKSMVQRDSITNLLRSREGEERLPEVKRKITFPTRRLYRGLGPSVTRSIITTTVFFTCYEYFMAHIG